MRRLVATTGLALLLSACTGADPGEPAEEATGSPTATGTEQGTSAPESPSPTESVTASETQSPQDPPHPVSLPAYFDRDYNGGGLRLGPVVHRDATHVQRDVSYRSGDLRISGRLAIPHGRGPFPAVLMAHGYIDPDIYVTGQGMTRERAWLGSHGFVALHVDYRNHAASSDDPDSDLEMRLGYTEDVVNAVLALQEWDGPVDDERMAVVGRSMGGGVVYNVLAAQPGLVDAGVVWAPVSSDARDNFDRWIRDDPGRSGLSRQILRRYGDPRSPRPAVQEFWDEVSPRTYFDRVTEPVMIHHGTSDDSCPIRWSHATARAMQRAGVDVTYHVYEGEEHAFGPQFFLSMERTTRFLRRHLR